MSLCPNCGKELPEGVAVCECENQQLAETTINEVPVESPVDETATVSPETPIVTQMESEVPEVDGMLVTSDNNDDDEEYLGATKNCKLINVLSLILFVEGIISLLLINRWMAAILFFVAEIFVLLPNTKVQKLCKAKNSMADKKSQQAKIKETTKRLKSKNINFKFSFIIAIVCLICLIISFILPTPLININNNSVNETDMNNPEYEEEIVNSYEDEDTDEDIGADTTIESNEDIKATSFIRRSNFEIYETLKPYCNQIGYDLDSWMVYTNTDECLEIHGNQSESQLALVTKKQLIVQMRKDFFVTANGDYIIIAGKSSETDYIFGFVDAILAECPEELKYTGQYLWDNYEANVINGTATFEKEGVKYKVTYVPASSMWMITLDVR